MQKQFFFILLFAITLSSCSTIKVASDYDSKTDFKDYNTFAFYKYGIDKATISDLDKKRILRAIEKEMIDKGLAKSSNPDILISFYTKSREKVNINQNNNFFFGYFGYRYNPWFYNRPNNMSISQYTEGTLFIDIIDREKKEMVWQGIGTGALKMGDIEKKEERIKQFVKEIIMQYPPTKK